MVDFDALTRANLRRWREAKLTRNSLSDNVAKALVAARPRYRAVEAKTGGTKVYFLVQRRTRRNLSQPLMATKENR